MNAKEARQIMKEAKELARKSNIDVIYSFIREAAMKQQKSVEILGKTYPNIISYFDIESKQILESQGYVVNSADNLHITFEDGKTEIVPGYIRLEW